LGVGSLIDGSKKRLEEVRKIVKFAIEIEIEVCH
jgi:hypothetical protein